MWPGSDPVWAGGSSQRTPGGGIPGFVVHQDPFHLAAPHRQLGFGQRVARVDGVPEGRPAHRLIDQVAHLDEPGAVGDLRTEVRGRLLLDHPAQDSFERQQLGPEFLVAARGEPQLHRGPEVRLPEVPPHPIDRDGDTFDRVGGPGMVAVEALDPLGGEVVHGGDEQGVPRRVVVQQPSAGHAGSLLDAHRGGVGVAVLDQHGHRRVEDPLAGGAAAFLLAATAGVRGRAAHGDQIRQTGAPARGG
ncbi:hypothetical protein RHRU231_450069 [Rhodococcus ruber]|uniref:Uncharacterized protein n=1 Tax=Rhodococcus ruber TaxID=1830 RepID=A0A098BL19_9NOCA|nr:hypothetical protein RHRU231_450069 [Rhodococcus ruber]